MTLGHNLAGTTSQEGRPAATLLGVTKAFPGVVALDDVSLEVYPGEVHALLGENGAGKSTLIKVLTGTYRADSGRLLLNGEEARLADPHDAQSQGIALVPQDVLAIPHLSIGRNILLGRESVIVSRGALSRTEDAIARDALRRVGADFNPEVRASELSVPQLRLAQLARALSMDCNVLVLDEPTAALNEHDAEILLERVEMARAEGKAILYVTHRLSEVMRLATRVSVLREGRIVGQFKRTEIDREKIIDLLTKRTGSGGDAATPVVARGNYGRVMLSGSGLDDGDRLHGAAIRVRAGEVVGVAGVQGSGHGQLVQALGGLCKAAGTLEVDGVAHRLDSARTTFSKGVVVVPADRRNAGIVGGLSVLDNISISSRIRPTARALGLRWPGKELRMATEYVRELSIRPADPAAMVGQLSGGNQQKVVLSRALESKPKVLVVEEPTQGIDLNAKAEVRRLIREFAAEGGAVVVATSEFEELVGLADTALVMCMGRVVGTLSGDEITYRNILHHALS